MKLRIFQSNQGDCLLLTSADNKRMLIDGGKLGAFREHVAPHLKQLVGDKLDVVCVSHIDADHIEGILELMDNRVEWVVHRHQLATNNPTHPEPKVPEPPEVEDIWHNAFHEQIGKNSVAIANMFAAVAAILTSHEDPELQEFGLGRQNLATSERQAIRLSRRVGKAQLGIRLNQPSAGKLMFARPNQQAFPVGEMSVSIIGPFKSDLSKLRNEWNDWLRKNKAAIKKIKKQAKEDEADLLGTSLISAAAPLPLAAEALGQKENVTTPNLASLMLYVEEGEKSIVLTGDGHEADIMKGLRQIDKLKDGRGLHVNVLKVQHHGSEHNLDPDNPVFPRQVTADHYVFCGNGAHHNPDTRVVEAFLKARLGTATERSPNPEVGDTFKFWFSSSSKVPGVEDNQEQMKKIERLVKEYQDGSGGQMQSEFLESSSVEFSI
jgi:beta-lactamase superfamily II metal-dependent hydrolase